jgi:hypothetical protein
MKTLLNIFLSPQELEALNRTRSLKIDTESFLASIGVEEEIIKQRRINFTNPSPTHNVWRSGVEYTGTVEVPTGYNVKWYFEDHYTQKQVLSGTTNEVKGTFVYGIGRNVYDLVVIATKGEQSFARVYPGEVKCLPKLFTEAEANEVWDVSLGLKHVNGNNKIVNNRKVYVKGRYVGTGTISHFWQLNDKDDQPYHFAYHNVYIESKSTNPVMVIGAQCQNHIHDGATDENVKYGLRIKATGTGHGVYLRGAESGTTLTNISRRIGLYSVEIDGNKTCSSCVYIDSANTSVINYKTATFDQPELWNVYGHDAYNENFYLGHTNLDPLNGYSFAPISNGLYRGCISERSGNDGWQWGSHRDSETLRCVIKGAGVRNQTIHRNQVQFDSNKNCSFYMNRVEGDKDLVQLFSGRYGSSVEIFSNIFVSDAVGLVNFGIQNYQNVDGGTSDVSIFNNTIILKDQKALDIWNKTTTVTTKLNLIWANNIIVNGTTTEYKMINGFDQTYFKTQNLSNTDIDTVKFVDAAARDYHLSSLESPAFRPRLQFTKRHRLAEYDFEGVKFTKDVHGAYSGYELMT